MKTKAIVTTVLLAFVAASVIYLVVKETSGRPAASGQSASTSVPQSRETGTPEAAQSAKATPKKETESRPAASGQSASTSVPQSREAGTPEAAQSAKASPKLVAYYFHGNMRCRTCRTIEAYAKEAVQTGFAEALSDGRLAFRVVNIEEPANEHFVQDYQLTTRSVVLVQFADGKQEQWKNLARVWELVRDKEAFLKYVQDETRSYLEAPD